MKNVARIVVVALMATISVFMVQAPASAAIKTGCLPSQYKTMLDTNWTHNKTYLRTAMTTRLTNGDSYVLYDIQTITNNLLDMARKCDDRTTLEELADLYLVANPYKTNLDANGVPYADGHYEWHCMTSACVNWATHPKVENVIVSSQWIYLLARTLNTIVTIPYAERTATMNTFVSTYYYTIMKYHVYRWLVTSTQFGGLCGTPTSGLTHPAHMQKLKDEAYPLSPGHCGAVRDQDLWIIAATEELYDANIHDATRVALSEAFKTIIRNYLTVALDVVDFTRWINQGSRVAWDGRTINVFVLDPGRWKDHPDWQYAGYEGATPPTTPAIVSNVGWDISHSRRLVHALDTMYENKSIVGQSFPSVSFMTAMAYQVTYVSYDGGSDLRGRNYWGGANGWYRVGYGGSSGTPPYGLGKSILTGGYAMWAQYHPGTASDTYFTNAVADALANPSAWGITTAPDTSVDWLQILPSLMYIG